jgi:hypothetical protein
MSILRPGVNAAMPRETPRPKPARVMSPDAELLARIVAEFREMPGLRVTLPQAARLFGLETPRCEQLLELLVHDGTLALADRSYFRADTGRHCA